MKPIQKNKVININNKPSQKIQNDNFDQNKEENKNISNTNSNNNCIEGENKGIIYKKITKPPELENFDTISHMQQNIELFDKNCKDKITDQSYYCISCKQSVCISCGAFDHKDHILIQRDNCLFYDPNFFVEISKIIDISLDLNLKKESIKDSVEKSFLYIKQYLDELKNIKFREIDDYFEKTNNNLINLKNNFIEAKNFIENYYNKNKKFFNVNYNNNEKNNNTNNNTGQTEIFNNLDLENTIFIMNFDMMNLCDSKNLKVLDKVNELTNKINSVNDNLERKTNELISIINNYYNLELNHERYEDFYYDIKIRIQKYSQIIRQFQETISDIITKNGNIEKIKELLDIFDSKNKKNKDIIFQQSFFLNDKKQTENNDNTTPRLTSSNEKEKERKISNSKSNNYLLNTNNKEENKNNNNLKVNLNLYSNKKQNNNNKNNSNNLSSRSAKKIINNKKDKNIFSPNKNKFNKYNNLFPSNLSENRGGNTIYNTILSNRTISPNKINFEDIILDNRIIQRFFAYSINDFYKQNIILDNSNLNKIEDIQNSKNLTKNNKMNNTKTNFSNSKNKENIYNIKKFNTNKNNINKKNLFSNNNNKNNNTEEMDSSQYNIKSVAYLANYQNRYNSLKERTKPIIGTNQIYLFDSLSKKIIKKVTSLNKNEHGYSIFPDGCRHILIDNILYITGGNNNCGNIVLSYDISSNKLTRLSNFISEHYFHTLEYIDNFDCIICIGGENSSSCEIMDINDKKWKKLPSLNYPRANCNIYYNNITEHIYVLFGMKGNLWDKTNKNSDKIEVLNLNNIDKGWTNIEYYKSIGLDLKVNFCKTMPFTKDKLIIFGGNNVRNFEEQNFYALFDMNKNEIIKVDKQTMELIKLEEKKMRIADLALTKIN